MAEKQVGVRLAVIDGGKVKAELRSVGQEGAAAMEKIRAATGPASTGLVALNTAAQGIGEQVGGFAEQAGVLGRVLSTLGPAGTVAAAGVAVLAAGLSKGLADYAEAEKITLRLNAVLEATGYAAGLTGDQLDQFADGMEAATMATAEQVKTAAAVLATFKSISGDTFTRTLSLAQDLAATFGSDLSASAVQLGKALEDPINGISALARVGVTFSASQKDVIKGLVETGQKAEAQKLILDVLAQQVGGAGTGEAKSLSGAFKSASDALGNFLEELASLTGAAPGARAALDGIAEGINKVTVNALGAGSAGIQAAVAAKELAAAQKELAQAQELANATGLKEDFDAVAAWEKRVVDLKAKVEAVAAAARQADDKVDAAAAGRAKAQSDQATETALAQLAELNKEIAKLATPEEKIRELRDNLGEIVKRMNALKDQGGDPAAIDKTIEAATEYTRRAVAEIEKPGLDAANKASEQTRDLIADLTTSLNLFGQGREEFIRKYVERVGDGASDAEIKRIKDLAGALYDKQAAEKAAKEAAQDHDQVMEDGKRVLEEVRGAAEKYAARLAELDGLLKAGAISQETYAKAVEKARREMEDHAKDGVSGIRRALRKYAEEANDSAKQIDEAITGAFKSAEDALVEFVTTGKLNVSDLVNSIIADLARLAIRQGITGPLSSALGSVFGSTSVGIFHSGGRVGESRSQTREVPAALWGMAQRAHSGARIFAPGEVPIITQVGERVLNRQETQDYESGRMGLIASRAEKLSERLSMVVNVNGAAGNGEVVALVQEGISQALEKYDRTRARETAVEAVNAHRSRTPIGRLR